MMRALCLVVALLFGFVGSALAVDVSQLSDFENNPCFQALMDRNTDQHVDRKTHEHVDAPDSALEDACERSNGNVDQAWEHLVATWSPRAVPIGSPGYIVMARNVFVVLGLLLLGPVLPGYPIRGLVLLRMRQPAWPEAVTEIALRLVVATGLLMLLTVPFTRLLGSLAFMVFVVLAYPRRDADPIAHDPATGGILAGAIDDLVGSIGSLLAVALASRGDWRVILLGIGVMAAMSARPLARLRWRLRTRLRSRQAVAAILILLAVACAWSDPALHL